MAKLKIAGVQFKPVFGKKDVNIEKIKNYVINTTSDIIIFPELATCGYFYLDKSEIKKVAENFGGDTITLFQELSSKLNKIVIFGFPEI